MDRVSAREDGPSRKLLDQSCFQRSSSRWSNNTSAEDLFAEISIPRAYRFNDAKLMPIRSAAPQAPNFRA